MSQQPFCLSPSVGKLIAGPSASPAQKADISPCISDPPFSASAFPVELSETITYDDPGAVFTLPLSVILMKPLPPSQPVLLMPNSSLTLEGVVAAPFLYDSSALHHLSLAAIGDRPFSLPQGSVVATLILLPPTASPPPSSLLALHCPVEPLKPMLTISLNGCPFTGLVDTGADASVIRTKEWPASWPLSDSPSVQGVGGSQAAQVSTEWLSASVPDTSTRAYLKPFVLPLAFNLWGRDLLSQLHATLHIP